MGRASDHEPLALEQPMPSRVAATGMLGVDSRTSIDLSHVRAGSNCAASASPGRSSSQAIALIFQPTGVLTN